MIFDDLKKSKKRTLDGVRLPIEYFKASRFIDFSWPYSRVTLGFPSNRHVKVIISNLSNLTGFTSWPSSHKRVISTFGLSLLIDTGEGQKSADLCPLLKS